MMKAETSLFGRRRSDALRNGEKMIRKKCCRVSTKRRSPKMPIVVQQLYDTCSKVFKDARAVPPPQDVGKLRAILDKMKPEDLGLHEAYFNKADHAPEGSRIKYATIYHCENFSLCIFFLPARAVLPLHNHPGMTVFSKLLLGSMHIKSYDWIDPSLQSDDRVPPSKPRLARLEANAVYSAPCDTSILYPTSGGNIHSFTAITPCAVLDVMGPPYSKEDNRDCTYYIEFPYSDFTDDSEETRDVNLSYAWLGAIETPRDLRMDAIEYLGPEPEVVESC